MALDFPYPPTVGQTFAGPGGVIWTWDNVKWVGGGGSGSGGGSSSVVVSPTPPASSTVGQLWWDSTGGQLYIRYEDPNTQQWVTTHNIGFGVPLNVANGGTGIVTYSQGDLIYGSAPDTLARLTKSTAATRYLANTGASNNPAWDQVSLVNGVTGILPIANGGTGATTAAAAPWVETAGDTMTGGLTIAPASGFAALWLTKPVSGQGCIIQGNTGANARWVMSLGDASAETGGTGSNFTLARFNDAGTFIDNPLAINRNTGDATFSKQLIVAPSSGGANILINKPGGGAGVASTIYGQRAGVTRWAATFGDDVAESTGNVGSNFNIGRYNDAGAFVDLVYTLERSTGWMYLSGCLSIGGQALPKSPPVVAGTMAVGQIMGDSLQKNLYWNTDWKYSVSSDGCLLSIGDRGFTYYYATAGTIGTTAPIVQRFRIDGNGTTIISHTGGDGLTVLTPINTDAGIMLQNGNRKWQIHNQGFSSAGQFWIYDATAAALRLVLDPGGNSFNTTGTWVALTSDGRAKRDVQPYERGLADLVQLAPVTFKFNGEFGTVDDDTLQYGLVAQDVQPYVPEIVGERDWAPIDAEGKPTAEPESVLNLDPGRLIYAVINSIKELAARVTALEGAP